MAQDDKNVFGINDAMDVSVLPRAAQKWFGEVAGCCECSLLPAIRRRTDRGEWAMIREPA